MIIFNVECQAGELRENCGNCAEEKYIARCEEQRDEKSSRFSIRNIQRRSPNAHNRRTLCARNWNSPKNAVSQLQYCARRYARFPIRTRARATRVSFARGCHRAEHVSPIDFYRLLALQTGSHGNRPRPKRDVMQCTFSAPARMRFR